MLQEARRAGHTVHVAKLTHRLAMHFAERLKKPQEGGNLLKVSRCMYFSTALNATPKKGRNLSASAVGACHLHVLGWGV